MALNCGCFVVVLSKDSVVSKDIKKRKPRSTTLPRGFLIKLILMSEIAKKKFEILDYVISNEFTIDGLANKLNELTNLASTNKDQDSIEQIIIVEPKLKDYDSFGEWYIDYTAWKFMDMEDRLKFI